MPNTLITAKTAAWSSGASAVVLIGAEVAASALDTPLPAGVRLWLVVLVASTGVLAGLLFGLRHEIRHEIRRSEKRLEKRTVTKADVRQIVEAAIHSPELADAMVEHLLPHFTAAVEYGATRATVQRLHPVHSDN